MGRALWVRNEDRGGWRGRGRSRHLAILGEIGSSEIGSSEIGSSKIGSSKIGSSEIGSSEIGSSKIGSSEIGGSEIDGSEVKRQLWTTGRMSVYFLCGTANKNYI